MSTDTARTDSNLFKGWRRERYGWLLGLTGWQAAAAAAFLLPLLFSIARGHWLSALQLTPVSIGGLLLTAVPVRGRPAFRWLADLTMFLIGRATGWSMWRSAASTGGATPSQLKTVDLPGVLAALELHDGPPQGPSLARICVIQDTRAGRWAATARCVHPGLGIADDRARVNYANQLGSLLAAAARSEDISRISILVRTVPDDGAERAAWVADHRVANVPDVVRVASAQLESSVVAASVRHEVFVTVAVRESTRLKRAAREAGGGVTGRARVLYRHLQSVEQQLRGIGCTSVEWLNSEDLAGVIRTGYNPAAAGVLEAARQQAARGRTTLTGMPPGAAGPSVAPMPNARSYAHDSYVTVSYALLLPELPTHVGSLAAALAPKTPGERRCLALHYEPLDPAKSARQVEADAQNAELSGYVRQRYQLRESQKQKRAQREAATHEGQVAAGHTIVRVAGAAAITVPAGWSVEDQAAQFEADTRACQYRLWRAELAQDTGFVAACLPLGIGLPERGDR